MVQSTLVFLFNWSEQVNTEITMQKKEVSLTISQAVALDKKENKNLTRNLTCASFCDQRLIFSTLGLNSSKFEIGLYSEKKKEEKKRAGQIPASNAR